MVSSTRRSFAAALLSATFWKNMRAQHALSIRTISKEPAFYHGWPTLAKRANGDLMLVWSGGREAHVCPFGRVEWMISRDEGESWSWPRTLIDSDLDDRDAGIVETARGTLLVTTFTSLAYEPMLERARKQRLEGWSGEKLARWEAVDRRLAPADRRSLLGSWMIRSVDRGVNWSPPYRVPVNSPHGPIITSAGRLLYAGKDLYGPQGDIGVCESADDGHSWSWLAKIPARSGDRRQDYHELHMVEASSGRLIAHIRNHNRQNRNETLQSESEDGGKSWSIPHPIGAWGLPSHLLWLRDKRLLMTYGYRREPFGNQARLSEDEGRTWSAAIPLSSGGLSVDLGYPSTVELKDGSLLTVWYEVERESPQATLRQRRWRL